MFLRSQTRLLRAETKTMHPYEWGILGVKAIAPGLAIGRTISSRCPRDDHRHQPVASLAYRRARRDRVRHPPPILNSTNSNASCDALLHRKGGCPVHQLARSWLQYPLTLASSTVLSKPKQRASQTFSPWLQACVRELAFNFQQFLSQSCKNPKLVKSAQIRLLYVHLTWLAMRLAYLLRGLRRI